MKHPFLLYHWAPRSRRKSILKRGLLVGQRGPQKRSYWRPPYLCFSAFPNFAWGLSATHGPRGKWWDLWCVWSDRVEKVAHARREGWAPHPKEYRVTHSVPPRRCWLVGTRQFKGARYK